VTEVTEVKAESNGQVTAHGNGQVDLAGVKLDPTKLKIRELVEIETQLGRRVAEDMMTGMVGADFMQALLWIALKRLNSQITFDEAGEYDFAQVTNLLADAEDDQPVEGDAVDPPHPQSGSVSSAASPAPASSSPSPSSATSGG
jgi:hypothetical protein